MVGISTRSSMVKIKHLDPERSKKYTLEELQGLRIVGSILKDVRDLYRGGFVDRQLSLTEMSELIYKVSGKKFSRTIVRKAENAGEPLDWRSGSRGVSKEYLLAVSQLTPYTPDVLLDLSRGEYFMNVEPHPSLPELIEKCKEKWGDRFDSKRREAYVSEEDLELAMESSLRDTAHAHALAGLLGIPVTDVLKAALEGARSEYTFERIEAEEAKRLLDQEEEARRLAEQEKRQREAEAKRRLGEEEEERSA